MPLDEAAPAIPASEGTPLDGTGAATPASDRAPGPLVADGVELPDDVVDVVFVDEMEGGATSNAA